MDNINRTLYEIIGVPQDASSEEIEEACLRLGKKYNPDQNPDDPLAAKAFADIEAAFETLTNVKKRMDYDKWQVGNDGARQAGANSQNSVETSTPSFAKRNALSILVASVLVTTAIILAGMSHLFVSVATTVVNSNDSNDRMQADNIAHRIATDDCSVFVGMSTMELFSYYGKPISQAGASSYGGDYDGLEYTYSRCVFTLYKRRTNGVDEYKVINARLR